MFLEFRNKKPLVNSESFIAENVILIGDVTIEKDANLWYGTVLRGDINYIKVGVGTNIQENSTVHVDKTYAAIIGNNVTIGHNCIIHGCTIGDNSLIGMGSIILNGAEIGENTLIGAGSMVTGGKKIPSGVLCMGSPAKVIRELTEEEILSLKRSAENYINLSKEYKEL